MDNAGSELTCALGSGASRVYVGFADGSIRAITANGVESDPELPLSHVRWGLRASASGVTSVCGVEDDAKDMGTLLLVGSADGEIVVLRGELEVRRFQLESAVQQICYDQDGEFIVGDALGNLYGVTQYEVVWKRRLPGIATGDGVGVGCFYLGVAQPTVRAIARAKLLDVEKTLSNYILVATGQKHLLVTHRGEDFGVIPTRTPIATLASFSAADEDVVLAAGEEGVIYHLVSYRDTGPKDMPDFRFAVEVWAETSFPILKLMPIRPPASALKPSELAWICLGVHGEVAHFRGRECVKQWNAASFCSTERDLPVDLTLLHSENVNAEQQKGAIVFSQRIHVFAIELKGQQ